MNEEMPHDDELRALYRKLPADEPRAEIDEAILSAARRRSRDEVRRRVLRRIRWSLPLAAAAGVMLTIALTRLEERQDVALEPLAAAPQGEGSYGMAHDSAESMLAEESPAPAPAPPPAREPAELQRKNEADDSNAATGGHAGSAASRLQPRARDEARKAAAPPGAPPPGAAAQEPAAKASRQAPPAIGAMALARQDPWPFGLEAGLVAQEACRRAAAALGAECAFRENVATVVPAAPVALDRGHLAGTSTTRITMTLRDGVLHSVSLQIAGTGREETLVAPQ